MFQGTSLTYYWELLFNRLDIIENFLDRWFHWKKRLRVTPYTNCSLELKTCIPMPRLAAILTCLGLYAGRWIKMCHSLPMILILPILPVRTHPTFMNHCDSQNEGITLVFSVALRLDTISAVKRRPQSLACCLDLMLSCSPPSCPGLHWGSLR